ncbi:outer membrane protein assembly factor BamD [Segatella baroniae]|uniref:Outer membrane assembly lipoprotein YfiO n=1 Tax=Segatella baroniae F0067 TaxID=1115809 RepID=U2QHU2_9BACT|nr:outer membrane protein assembly factor BamD [Segatella baroniae]ERK38382.1 outer membrane assembly lipoprotein YfiO [Segatella baroniae F0067]
MKKTTFLSLTLGVFLLSGCAHEFNLVYKSSDSNYRYEYAKECFVKGKYTNAITLLTELITVEKGTENAQESLYMLGMANYFNRDYETAAQTFKRYYQSYPRGVYAEMARYYEGQSLYLSTPEPRLDQSQTVSAIAAYQEYLDAYPDAKLKKEAQQHLFELQEKLVTKELYTARLYYDLGPYFGNCTEGGNNFEACIVTAQNALKDYPFTDRREDFSALIMKSKYELARQSVEEKKVQRYQDAEDECYGFINQFPDSKLRSTAEKYIARCKAVTGEKVAQEQ